MKLSRVVVCCVLALVSACAAAVPGPVKAADESVAVWLTTADGSNRLAPQPPLTFAPDTTPYNPLTIHVDENHTYQQVDGFGASLTDTSAWLLYNSPMSTTVMRDLFDPVNGIGISFLRQPIGASDFTWNATPYSYDDMPAGQTDPDLVHFSITHDMTYIVPLLQQALRLNPDLKIMATPWSPPGWMKANGLMTDANNAGPLLPTSYGPLAAYFVKFIQAYQAQGIPIYAITPQNEPDFGAPNYPGMHFPAGDEANFVKNYLGPALANAGLAPKILGYDFDWGWNSTAINDPFVIMDDPAAASYLAGMAYHCYSGDPDAMTQMHDAYPQKDVYETECSTMASSPRTAIELVIDAMRNWSKTVVLWNVALNPYGGPKQGDDCGCIGLATVDQSTGNVSYTQDYYQLGHASKFVSPGAYRIDSNTFGSGTYGSATVDDVAFKNPDGSKVLIAYNSASSSQTFKVAWGSEAFSYTLPAGATVTFTWFGTQDNGASVAPPSPTYYAIDSGAAGTGAFMPDSYFYDGLSNSTAATVDTSAVIDPAPQGVYQTQRMGAAGFANMAPEGFTYTLPGLRAGTAYGIRLHFAELTATASGQRQFNVSINSAPVLTNFDIFAQAGGQNKAIVEQFVATADNSGTITIQFSPGAADSPVVNGIEIVDPALLPPTPTATSVPANTATPSATATASPTSTRIPATATPTPTNTATPTATSSPSSTTQPLPTAAVATSTPAARKTVRTPTPPPPCAGRAVQITVPHRTVRDDGAVTVRGFGAPRERVTLITALTRVLDAVIGHGKQRVHHVRTVVLYRSALHTMTDGKGWMTRTVRVHYALSKAVKAMLTATLDTACGHLVRTMGVTVVPPPHFLAPTLPHVVLYWQRRWQVTLLR